MCILLCTDVTNPCERHNTGVNQCITSHTKPYTGLSRLPKFAYSVFFNNVLYFTKIRLPFLRKPSLLSTEVYVLFKSVPFCSTTQDASRPFCWSRLPNFRLK